MPFQAVFLCKLTTIFATGRGLIHTCISQGRREGARERKREGRGEREKEREREIHVVPHVAQMQICLSYQIFASSVVDQRMQVEKHVIGGRA